MEFIRGAKITEGKTKIIWEESFSEETVLIESKKDLTAGDGARHDKLEDKDILSTSTSLNCFRLLNAKGISTHFLRQVGERTFLAKRCKMIPLELVARRIAAGSFLLRHPEVKEGTIFPEPRIEFFDKNDSRHDPLIIHDFVSKRILVFEAKKPLKEGFVEELPMDSDTEPIEYLLFNLRDLTSKVFEILEEAWAKLGVTLVDLKIEAGYAGSELVVADVIDNDSWRIWPGGDKAKMLDKEVYRQLREISPEALEVIHKNYALVAELTRKF